MGPHNSHSVKQAEQPRPSSSLAERLWGGGGRSNYLRRESGVFQGGLSVFTQPSVYQQIPGENNRSFFKIIFLKLVIMIAAANSA